MQRTIKRVYLSSKRISTREFKNMSEFVEEWSCTCRRRVETGAVAASASDDDPCPHSRSADLACQGRSGKRAGRCQDYNTDA
jgi:hypothetical protein